jgi:hypothetical protein
MLLVCLTMDAKITKAAPDGVAVEKPERGGPHARGEIEPQWMLCRLTQLPQEAEKAV